jgi:hypothetical protein
MSLNRPSFDARPMGSIEALAKALAVDAGKLVRTAAGADRLYRGPIFIRKAGRKPRPVFAALPMLRDIQQRILDRILRRADLPSYLMGGIPGRSYVGNANFHARAKVLCGQDVDSFYPSITTQRIQFIFRDVFHFPPDVAQLLAKLCTRRGVLVQGGVASTDLANLALYRTEPALDRWAERSGLRYSRFVDDVHVSSTRWLPPLVLTRVLRTMRGMLERDGFQPKRAKQFVASAAHAMRVHGLNVNAAASTPRQRRRHLRTEVFLLERWVDMQPWDGRVEQVFRRLSARVGQLKQLNPGDARRLQGRLRALLPLRSAALLAKLPTLRRADNGVCAE